MKRKKIPKRTPEERDRDERALEMLRERIAYYEQKLGPNRPSSA